jgi:hypothetical protein
MRRTPGPGLRVLHLVDDEPAESAVAVEARRGCSAWSRRPAVPFEEAWPKMSPMARASGARTAAWPTPATKAALGIAWRHPTWREGLAAILREERGKGAA